MPSLDERLREHIDGEQRPHDHPIGRDAFECELGKDLAAAAEVVAYGRDVCMFVGHVRSGVGDMNVCSRCAEPVNDQTMQASIDNSHRARAAKLHDALEALVRVIEDGADIQHCDQCRAALANAVTLL